MKVIELLNKIANGEEVPKKIKVYGDIFVLDEGNNVYEKEIIGGNLLNIYNGNILTCEVEIIEEDKKIEKIYWKSCADNLKQVNGNIDELSKKINEIIDYLEENK